MTASTLTSALVSSFKSAGGQVLISDGSRSLTGLEVCAAMDGMAGRLMTLGVVPGDRVAVQAPKSLDLVLLYLGCLRLGAVYVPLNDTYRADEISYFLGDAEPALFICSPEAGATLIGTDIVPRSVALHTLGADGEGSFLAAQAPVARSLPQITPVPGDLAAIVYTSGTTGRSKGAMLSQANLLANARDLGQIWGIASTDVLLHALPLFHIHGLFIALHPLLLAGGRINLLSGFEAGAVIDAMPTSTLFMGVPTHYTRLLADPDLSRAATANVRLFISGSAPLTPATFDRFAERTGHYILERYGMTECGIICSNRLDGPRHAGTVGYALPGYDVRIADGAQTGVLEVKGESLFTGYWRQPEKTKEEFRDDGYFITGDIATIEPDGLVRIVGRDKDMIISGGLNIYPIEIETLIEAMPEISDVAVVGVPHPDFGEAVLAIICPVKGAIIESATIVDRLRPHLAAFKLPKAIEVADALPRNAMGKVQKSELRRIHADRF